MKLIRLVFFQIFLAGALSISLFSTALAGGSRVGNGNGKPGTVRISIDKSYDIDSFFPYTQKKEFPDGLRLEGLPELKIKSSMFGPSPRMEKQKIDFMRFAEQRPELVKLSKVDLVHFFEANNWTTLKIESDCAVAKFKETPEYVTAIVSWGQNKGFVASTPNSTSSKKALLEMIKSTYIYDKGCSWK